MIRQLPHHDKPEKTSGQKFFWARPCRQVVDIFRKPLGKLDKLNERALARNRQTQASRIDLPFKVLKQEDGWGLAELADGTFGWLPEQTFESVKKQNYWKNIALAPRGKLFTINDPGQQKIIYILKQFEAIPYLWGGTTKRGMDCSAFIQKVFWELGKILLPRNSREQKKCGQSVRSTSLCALDIVFFVHSKTGRHHVGVYFDNLVWHFCLDRQGLSTETLGSIQKRYNYLTARRIFKIKHA